MLICVRCGKRITEVAYWCPRCRWHLSWYCSNGGQCHKCGTSLQRVER